MCPPSGMAGLTSARFSTIKNSSVNARMISGAICSCVLLLSSTKEHTQVTVMMTPDLCHEQVSRPYCFIRVLYSCHSGFSAVKSRRSLADSAELHMGEIRYSSLLTAAPPPSLPGMYLFVCVSSILMSNFITCNLSSPVCWQARVIRQGHSRPSGRHCTN